MKPEFETALASSGVDTLSRLAAISGIALARLVKVARGEAPTDEERDLIASALDADADELFDAGKEQGQCEP